MKLSNVFVGMPRWNRPTHEANRAAILAGTAKCICVPSTATRVVVEMWGQGGGGSPGNCQTNGIYGGQGGSYSNKVFTDVNSPACMGTCILFCGCVCTCDCMAIPVAGVPTCGHCGQFSWLRNCNTVGAMANWYGCTTGGVGGVPLCSHTVFWHEALNKCSLHFCMYGNNITCGLPFNSEYNTLCLDINKKTLFALQNMSISNSANLSGGSCVGSSCFCADTLTSASVTGTGTFNTNELTLAIHQNNNSLNNIFKCLYCSCFDNYRLGACGFTDLNDATPLAKAGIWTCDISAMIGVGGASYAGGSQQHCSNQVSNMAYMGMGGYFPGGGGRSSATYGVGYLCNGSIGGAGLIIISWN